MLISQTTSNETGSPLHSRLLLHDELLLSSPVISSLQLIQALQWHGAQGIASTECVEMEG